MPRAAKPDELRVINMTTNEIYDLEPPYENGATWYKTTRAELVRAMKCLGDPRSAVLGELLRVMTYGNEIHSTVAEIAEELEISQKTVHRVLKNLETHSVIKRVRNGRLLMNPKVMRNGKSAFAGFAKANWEKY